MAGQVWVPVDPLKPEEPAEPVLLAAELLLVPLEATDPVLPELLTEPELADPVIADPTVEDAEPLAAVELAPLLTLPTEPELAPALPDEALDVERLEAAELVLAPALPEEAVAPEPVEVEADPAVVAAEPEVAVVADPVVDAVAAVLPELAVALEVVPLAVVEDAVATLLDEVLEEVPAEPVVLPEEVAELPAVAEPVLDDELFFPEAPVLPELVDAAAFPLEALPVDEDLLLVPADEEPVADPLVPEIEEEVERLAPEEAVSVVEVDPPELVPLLPLPEAERLEVERLAAAVPDAVALELPGPLEAVLLDADVDTELLLEAPWEAVVLTAVVALLLALDGPVADLPQPATPKNAAPTKAATLTLRTLSHSILLVNQVHWSLLPPAMMHPPDRRSGHHDSKEPARSRTLGQIGADLTTPG